MVTDEKRAEFVGTLLDTLRGEDESRAALVRAGLDVLSLVLDKNAAYGDSMRNPLEVFARDLDPATRIAVRMDDKINRMVRGEGREALGEDVVVDLAGYCLGLLSLDRGNPEIDLKVQCRYGEGAPKSFHGHPLVARCQDPAVVVLGEKDAPRPRWTYCRYHASGLRQYLESPKFTVHEFPLGVGLLSLDRGNPEPVSPPTCRHGEDWEGHLTGGACGKEAVVVLGKGDLSVSRWTYCQEHGDGMFKILSGWSEDWSRFPLEVLS